MNTFFRHLGAVGVVCATLVSGAMAAPAKKVPAKKPPAKTPAKKPGIGIKKTPQMAGGVVRFGDLYGLKSGFTFQILSARYSYDAFDDYGGLYPTPDHKLLVLRVAIKNNTPADLYFDGNSHEFQIQASNNELYSGASYRLASAKSKAFNSNLKPGLGMGQGADNPFEVAIEIPDTAQVSKIILKQGRKGTSEDVLRFLVAGTQGGDPKNVIAPPSVGNGTPPFKPDGFFPSSYFQFRINSVQFVPGPIAGTDAPENRQFAVVNITYKNATSIPQSYYDFLAGGLDRVAFADSDGENYPANGDIGVLKASSDEKSEGDIAPGAEKTCRIVIPVPKTVTLKTLTIGSAKGHLWTLDASSWK
ncbi:hypothetical protein IAD21_01656 [Abditibacteriota bacterium]|nr:hypothetical protein IAD21_01656 [Abditibacteriota bacterium]